jgi:hypothetical protein
VTRRLRREALDLALVVVVALQLLGVLVLLGWALPFLPAWWPGR